MAGTEVALREAVDGTVAQLRDPDFEQQVALAVPEGVSPRKMLRVAATAVLENPELGRPDLRASLLQATLKAAADGLVPDGRQAAFVIFGGKEPKVVYMAMIGGLRDIAAEHGWAIFTACVYDKDGFDPDFENMRANHKPARLGTPRGAFLGAYATAQHRDGRRLLEVMDKGEIDKVRATSRSPQKGPWADWYERQAEKTVGRRLFKKIPFDSKDRERIDRVLASTDDDGVTVLYGSQDDPPPPTGDRTPQARPPQAAPQESGQQAGAPATDAPVPGSDDVPFEGEEPTSFEPPAPEPQASAATFTHGKHAGRTLDEVYALGKEGAGYIAWAYKSWKPDQQPMRAALDAFAKAHPDVTA